MRTLRMEEWVQLNCASTKYRDVQAASVEARSTEFSIPTEAHFPEVACAGALPRESGKVRGTITVGAVWGWKTGTLIIANFG